VCVCVCVCVLTNTYAIRQALSKCKIGLARGNAQVSLDAHIYTDAHAHAQDVYTHTHDTNNRRAVTPRRIINTYIIYLNNHFQYLRPYTHTRDDLHAFCERSKTQYLYTPPHPHTKRGLTFENNH
jgi:hypothetical protein